jgi:hypothetical protein
MSYTPREGSIAFRTIELLTARAPLKVGIVDICDEIDCERQSFHASVAMAIRAGVIAIEEVDGETLYSLGDGVPLPEASPPAPSVEAPPPTPRAAPARKYAAAPKLDPAPPPETKKATPFKRWLKKKGEPSAEAPRKKRAAAKKAKPAPAPKPKRAYVRRPPSSPHRRRRRLRLVAACSAPSSTPAPSSSRPTTVTR